MPVMRLGYAHLRVEDLDAAKRHYAGTLGMRITAEGDGRIHLKGLGQFDHHSIVLEGGGAGDILAMDGVPGWTPAHSGRAPAAQAAAKATSGARPATPTLVARFEM